MRRKSSRRRESVRPSIVQSISGTGQNEWIAKLAQARIECLLPDRRLVAESIQVGQQLLPAGEEIVAAHEQAIDVISRGGDAHGLGQREEREHERDDDSPEQ